MLPCSHVIESSTEEKRYRPGHGKQTRLVWLQQTKAISNQVLDSYAVSPTDERRQRREGYLSRAAPIYDLMTLLTSIAERSLRSKTTHCRRWPRKLRALSLGVINTFT
ncbi:hypothetical protein CDEST_06722 [Colletotrichum destructivum]|uniref:Uncharacterized protein n=1 Tax=Colletotrichum destructivum TaxID=34406 RepID=A0AAX4IE59_9PEZI|nr:hypothetical protein CDEST_06722 [Colletotrichum destructivum]